MWLGAYLCSGGIAFGRRLTREDNSQLLDFHGLPEVSASSAASEPLGLARVRPTVHGRRLVLGSILAIATTEPTHTAKDRAQPTLHQGSPHPYAVLPMGRAPAVLVWALTPVASLLLFVIHLVSIPTTLLADS